MEELRRLATLQLSAEQGSPESQSALADEYMELAEKAEIAGDETSQAKAEKAMYHFYQKAAEGGYAYAQMRFGLKHVPSSMDGEPIDSVDEDLATGLLWLKRAASQEDSEEAAYYARRIEAKMAAKLQPPAAAPPSAAAAPAAIKVFCRNCGQVGHTADTCVAIKVFEASQAHGPSTPDTNQLLKGIVPEASGDWSMTIMATPRADRASGTPHVAEGVYEDLQHLLWDNHCNFTSVKLCTRHSTSATSSLHARRASLTHTHPLLASLAILLLPPSPSCKCKTGEHPILRDEENQDLPCACWPDKHVPENFCVNCEWDGNCSELSWDSGGYTFSLELNTS